MDLLRSLRHRTRSAPFVGFVPALLSVASLVTGLLPSVSLARNPLPGFALLRAQKDSGRPLAVDLKFLRFQKGDTGFSIEKVLVFHDVAGSMIYVLTDGLDGGLFQENLYYHLRLRIRAINRSGIPVAEYAPAGVVLAEGEEKYQGDIRENDPRVREILESMGKGSPPPGKIRLRFGGIRNDIYLMFYDIEGREIYYKFRDDRFDDFAMKKADLLREGEAYLVTGKYLGVMGPNKILSQDDAAYAETLGKKEALLVYSYQDAAALRVEQLLL